MWKEDVLILYYIHTHTYTVYVQNYLVLYARTCSCLSFVINMKNSIAKALNKHFVKIVFLIQHASTRICRIATDISY